MSDQKNLIIAIVVSVAILLGFQFFIEKPKQDRLREQQAIEQAQKAATAPAGTAPTASGVLPQLPTLPQTPAELAVSRDKALDKSARVKIEGKRSEARRVGEAGVSTCRSRWSRSP